VAEREDEPCAQTIVLQRSVGREIAKHWLRKFRRASDSLSMSMLLNLFFVFIYDRTPLLWFPSSLAAGRGYGEDKYGRDGNASLTPARQPLLAYQPVLLCDGGLSEVQ
jgi:hypothetical protein